MCLAFLSLLLLLFSAYSRDSRLSQLLKLAPLNRRLLSFQKQQKPMVCQKVHLKFYTHIVKH